MAAEVARAGAFSVLRKQAEKSGVVMVIVNLRVSVVPEGKLRPEEVERQRKEIARMQEAVLEKVPSLRQKAVSIKRFGGIPSMALSATATELDALSALPEVESIQGDSLMSINAGEGLMK